MERNGIEKESTEMKESKGKKTREEVEGKKKVRLYSRIQRITTLRAWYTDNKIASWLQRFDFTFIYEGVFRVLGLF